VSERYTATASIEAVLRSDTIDRYVVGVLALALEAEVSLLRPTPRGGLDPLVS